MNSLVFMLILIFGCVCFILAIGWMGMMIFLNFHHSKTKLVNQQARKATGNHNCPHCGAGLDANTEISPSGDFKCAYCQKWSNAR